LGLDDERDIKGNDMPSASQILRQLCCIPSNHPEDNSLDEMARPTSVNPLQQQGSSVARTPSCSTDNVHNVSPEEKKLFADTFSFRHPEYGSVDIHRDNKKESDRIITLTIKMDDEKQKKDGVRRCIYPTKIRSTMAIRRYDTAIFFSQRICKIKELATFYTMPLQMQHRG